MMSGRLLLLLLAFSGVWRTKQSFLQNAPDAPYGCCMICTHIIDTELTFLSISEEKRAQTRENIQNWIDVNSFLQVEATKEFKFECCSICMTSFVPDDEVSMTDRDELPGLPKEFMKVPGMRDFRKKSAQGQVAAAAAGESSFMEILARMSNKKTDKAPFGPGSCCNVCMRSTEKSSTKGRQKFSPGQGKGKSRTEGGCCTLCPSRFYGAQVYGAPPFSEPGNREQNIVAGSRRGLYRPDGLQTRVSGLTSDKFNNDRKKFDPQGVLQ